MSFDATLITSILAASGTIPAITATILKSASDISKSKKYLKELEERLAQEQTEEVTFENMIDDLSKRYRDNSLVLVLGAGVSIDYNLPSWNELLQKLLITTIKSETNQTEEKSSTVAKIFTKVYPLSPLIAGRYLDNYYCKNTENYSFEKSVRRLLYENLKEDDTTLVKEIVQMCVAPGNAPNLDSIITYNYDDIIENAIRSLEIDVPFNSIYKLGQSYSPNELPIYHVHGFLPRNGEIDSRNKITLSESVYHQQYNETYSWNNMVQINKFRDCTCLFIGNSFSDPNLRRLHDIANMQKGDETKYNYIFKEKHDYIEVENIIKAILEQNKDIHEEKSSNGLELKEVSKYLVAIMQKFEEQDAKSFGMRVIWVNSYDEIPLIIKKIRRRVIL